MIYEIRALQAKVLNKIMYDPFDFDVSDKVDWQLIPEQVLAQYV